MRTVRVTGVTGDSTWVPLDAYSPNRASVQSNQATLAIEITMDNVFDLSITPLESPLALIDGFLELPVGTRGVRGTGMVPADVLVVSQQGLA
jgi:hypothetical protein